MKEKIAQLHELVSLFKSNISQYKSQNYDEANLRVDFADKFFEILDWDVRNTKGFAENYRDVVREDKIVISGKPKAPDYSFRIGGHRKFFVETKRPSVNIKDDGVSAFQIRRYGFTAKLPLCILTDFEEFAVYDTRIKPSNKDKSNVGRIFYCTFDEYEKHFEFIYNIFSKSSILKGSFDKYITSNKKGVSEVDKEFLKLIEGWRTDFAKNIAKNNLKLNIEEINFAVQKIINRIIFLRIAEDRHVEEYETLLKLTKKQKIYKNFSELCLKADLKYNSQLFYTEEYLKKISIDDDILSGIIEGLYYPECPYEFSVMEVEILGNIYEQFLGKVIRLTESHHAKVEEKPEVRKAGGVYYTPQYIVDYIVQNTVGEKIKDKKPEEIENLTILDPACGSGSFLLGAYSYLMEYYLKYYINNENLSKALKTAKVYQISENHFKLTIEEKRKILLNNIYGVDIDSQAVEVTKLSLLLKLMENENQESVGALFKYSDLKVLPDLSHNIKCGNSLIGTDYYAKQDMGLFDNKDMKKVNAFDWDKEFPEIFKSGGLDVVIGNPPYISIEELTKIQGTYFLENFKTTKGRVNTFSLFLERVNDLLKNEGIDGFIVSNRILTNTQLDSLRQFLLTKFSINEIITFNKMVFKDAFVDTIILIMHKTNKSENISIKINRDNSNIHLKHDNEIKASTWLSNPYFIFNLEQENKFIELLYKIESLSSNLDTVCEIKDGIILGSIKELYLAKKKKDPRYEKFLEGNCVSRYNIDWDVKWICYDKGLIDEELKTKYDQFKNIKNNSEEFKKKSRPGVWLRERYIFEQPKIITRQNAKRIIGTFDHYNYFVKNSLHCILEKDKRYDLKFILGILNSKMMDIYFQNKIGKTGDIFSQMKIEYLKKLPIIKYENIRAQISLDIAHNVDNILNENIKYNKTKIDSEKEQIKKKIDIIDKQIDRLVYEVYGLTEEEIKVVEESK